MRELIRPVRFPLLVVAALLVTACGGDAPAATTTVASTAVPTTSAPTTTATSVTTVDWGADLDALDHSLRNIHPNPFWRMTESEWESRLADARQLLPTLDRRHAEMVMFALTALIDGHSGIYPYEIGYHLYALRLYHFTDGYFVLDAPDSTAIGGRLVAINGMPVEEAVELVTPLAAHDNDKTIEVVVPAYLMTSEMLEGLGIVDDITQPRFEVRRDDGTTVELDPPMVDIDTYTAQFDGFPVGLPKAAQPLSQSRRDETFWWTTIGDALYFQYNEVQRSSPSGSLAAVVADMRQRIEGGGVSRVIVDVRHNPGGNNQTYGPLLNLLLDPEVDRPGALYVIIGRQTFSAATNFATELDVRSSAVFVGEPTGGRPNLYGDAKRVTLPSSKLPVHVSSRYWEMSTPDDTRPWIPPDIPVELSSIDYLAGVDPVLDAALAA